MPASAEILSLQIQDGIPCIWAKVNSEEIPSDCDFRWFGTGQPLPDNVSDMEYVGIIQYSGLVFHLFKKRP